MAPGILLVVASAVGLLSCAGPATQVLNLHYRPLEEPKAPSAFVVGLAPFQDARSNPQSIGRRTRMDGAVEQIVLGSQSPPQEITYILIRYLEAKGVRVMDLPSWKGDPDSLKNLPKDIRLAIAGRVDALEVEATSSLTTSVRYRVRLTIHLGSVDKGEVLTRSVELSPLRTTFQFDIREVEDELNRTLMEAIGRLLEGFLPTAS